GLTAGTATEFDPVVFDPEDAARLTRFVARLHEWRIRRESVSFDRLLMAAIDDCGYPESPNLDKFLAQARDAAPRMSLDRFVEDLALVRASNPREPDERKVRESEESNRLLYVAMTRAEQHLVLSFSGNGRKLANWAAVVANSLHLDVVSPRDEIVTFTAPDGKPWNLRLLATAAPSYL